MSSRPLHRWLFVSLIAAGLIATSFVAVGPAAARADPGALTVDLAANGSATLSVTYRYDLAGERASAFEDLRNDTAAQQTTAQRFADRVRSIARDLENQTGRTMSVSNPRAAVSTSDGIGTVTLSVTWDGLAAVDGDRVTLAEPFDAGFESSRPLVVEVPAGYRATATTPAPAESTDGTLRWTADQSLAEFSVAIEPATTPTGGPGLGPGVAVLALGALAVGALARL
ncbi:MAG: hypothetical protein ABEJ86_00100 [Halococcoides sp.]